VFFFRWPFLVGFTLTMFLTFLIRNARKIISLFILILILGFIHNIIYPPITAKALLAGDPTSTIEMRNLTQDAFEQSVKASLLFNHPLDFAPDEYPVVVTNKTGHTFTDILQLVCQVNEKVTNTLDGSVYGDRQYQVVLYYNIFDFKLLPNKTTRYAFTQQKNTDTPNLPTLKEMQETHVKREVVFSACKAFGNSSIANEYYESIGGNKNIALRLTDYGRAHRWDDALADDHYYDYGDQTHTYYRLFF